MKMTYLLAFLAICLVALLGPPPVMAAGLDGYYGPSFTNIVFDTAVEADDQNPLSEHMTPYIKSTIGAGLYDDPGGIMNTSLVDWANISVTPAITTYTGLIGSTGHQPSLYAGVGVMGAFTEPVVVRR